MFKGIIRDINKTDFQAVADILSLYWTDKEFLNHLLARLKSVIENSDDSIRQGFKYFVAEKDSEVVGVVGFRKIPSHMLEFAKTENPCELYILAVKNRKDGTGRALVEKMLAMARELGYTEILLFSPESLKMSWSFYDHIGFKRLSPAMAPNKEAGFVWQMIL